MRVLHCITTLDPRAGGTVEAARLLALGMLGQGVDAEILSLDPPDAPDRDNWPCRVHRLGPAYGRYLFAPRYLPWLLRYGPGYDALIIHDMYRYVGYGVWRANRITGLRYYLFTHGMLDPWFNRLSVKALKKKAFWKTVGHRMLRDAGAVLYTAQDEKLLARQSYTPFDCRERVVGLGIDDPAANERLAPAEFRAGTGIPDSADYLLFLGRITPKKRVDLLIQAFAEAYAGDNTRLVVAGPDEAGLHPELSRLAAAAGVHQRVLWTGHLDGPAKWAAIAGASAMALISHTENFGISLVEALAMGVPVLTTQRVNIWREIVDGGAGFAETDDLEGAVRLLARWRSISPQQKKEMRTRARRVFLASFAIDRVVTALLDVISSDCWIASKVAALPTS